MAISKSGSNRTEVAPHNTERDAVPPEDPNQYAQLLCLSRRIFKSEKAATVWAVDNGYRHKQTKHNERDFVFVQRRAELFKPGTFHRVDLKVAGKAIPGAVMVVGDAKRKPVLSSRGDIKNAAKSRIGRRAKRRLINVPANEQRALTRDIMRRYGFGLESGEIADDLKVNAASVTALLKSGIDKNHSAWAGSNHRENWARFASFHMVMINELELACQIFMEDPDSRQYTALVSARKAQADIYNHLFDEGVKFGLIDMKPPADKIHGKDRAGMIETLRDELKVLTDLIAELEIEQTRTVTRVKVKMNAGSGKVAAKRRQLVPGETRVIKTEDDEIDAELNAAVEEERAGASDG